MVIYLGPMAVLAALVLAVVAIRSPLGSPAPDASGSAPGIPDAVTAPVLAATSPSARPAAAAKLPSMGVRSGLVRIRGPRDLGAGNWSVVFVLDGPRRVVRTDRTEPFSTTVDTTTLPNGAYTVTVVSLREGHASKVSTRTVRIRNTAPAPTGRPSSERSASPSSTEPTPSASPDRASTRPSASARPVSGGNAGYVAAVLDLTNAERAKAGCRALRADRRLADAAAGHSADMAAKDYFDHTGKDGRSPFQRITDAGYSYRAAAENIAAGQRTPTDVVSAWMKSPGHRANILNCTYTDLGVGYALARGMSYWTQDFGAPR